MHKLFISKRTYLDKARNHVNAEIKLPSPYAIEGVFKSLSYQDAASTMGKLRMAEWGLGKAGNCVEQGPSEDRTLGYRDNHNEWHERMDCCKRECLDI